MAADRDGSSYVLVSGSIRCTTPSRSSTTQTKPNPAVMKTGPAPVLIAATSLLVLASIQYISFLSEPVTYTDPNATVTPSPTGMLIRACSAPLAESNRDSNDL